MRTTLAMLLFAIFVTILAGCALLTQTLGPDHDPTKVACDAFKLISWAPGNEAEGMRMLAEIRDGKRLINRETVTVLREVLGDTSATIAEVKPHNAAYRALCTKPLTPSETARVSAGFRAAG